MKFFSRKIKSKGYTLIELMLVIGIMGLIVPSLTQLFTITSQGLASSEMHFQLKAMNELIQLHLHERMNASKHMFQNNVYSGGLSFIGEINMGTAPASVAFSSMAQAQSQVSTAVTNSLSPNSGAVASQFGDCLFYAAADQSQTINGTVYTAPISVTNVVNSSGSTVSLNLDVYRFYYDYLSTAGDQKPIKSTTAYWLIEWQSIQFIDARELMDIMTADTTLGQNVIKWLCTGSNFTNGLPVTFAWDPSQTQITGGSNDAFLELSGSTTVGFAPANQGITMQNWTVLSRIGTGALNNFNYGISGNYSNLAGDPPPPNVPKFAASNSNGYPGGFEVGILGANGGMEVMIRSMMIAKGNSKILMWDDETAVSNVRDVW